MQQQKKRYYILFFPMNPIFHYQSEIVKTITVLGRGFI